MQALGFDQRNVKGYVFTLTLMGIGCIIILVKMALDAARNDEVEMFSVICYLAALSHIALAVHRIRKAGTQVSEWFATALMTASIAVASGGERVELAVLMAGSGIFLFGISRALGEKANVQSKTRYIRIRIPWLG